MYSNVAEQLKKIAIRLFAVCCTLSIISVIVLTIFSIVEGDVSYFIIGLVTGIVTPLSAYISYLSLYAVGEQLTILKKIEKNTEKTNILQTKYANPVKDINTKEASPIDDMKTIDKNQESYMAIGSINMIDKL